MAYDGKNPFVIPRPIRQPGGFTLETIAGTRTLTFKDSQFIGLASGAPRQVILPVEGARKGAFFWIANKSAGADAITLLQPDGSTNVCTISQNEAAMVFCDADGEAAGASGWSLFALVAIAIA